MGGGVFRGLVLWGSRLLDLRGLGLAASGVGVRGLRICVEGFGALG